MLQRAVRIAGIIVMLATTGADAATFTVTSTKATGIGTLHQAILDANADDVLDEIHFDIAGDEVHTIGGDLPDITQPVKIDGYTQPGSARNTIETGKTNATIRIQLDGSALPLQQAVLRISKGTTTIEGLSIAGIKSKSFGIQIDTGVIARVFGCFIGVEADGETDASQGTGILVQGFATIGDNPEERNVISGNDTTGIQLSSNGSQVTDNMIGVDRGGAPLGNGDGIRLDASAANHSVTSSEIASNEGHGIVLDARAAGPNQFAANSIHDNGGLGIDLKDDGVTPNDPGDLDGGPNNLQNYPEITSARINGDVLHVQGFLDSTPTLFTIELYRSPEPDPSGFGEGETLLEVFSLDVVQGEISHFTREVELASAPSQPFFVTALARQVGNPRTSEFSRAVEAPIGGSEIVVTNANDAGAGSLRQALLDANADAAPNTILFDIPGDGPHVITPLTAMQILEPVIIDGFSQPGSRPNSLPSGSDAVMLIVVDATLVDGLGMFTITNTSATMRGLVVQGAQGDGIRIIGGENVRIEGNYLGIGSDGASPFGNGSEGVDVASGSGTTIGGPSAGQRNVISGNGGGIRDNGQQTTILNNIIGGDASGETAVPNANAGISATGNTTTIGDEDPLLGNRIEGNGKEGITVLFDASGVEILANSIVDNDEIGIDLSSVDGADGLTLNDPDDADSGGNARQNFPVLETLSADAAEFTLDGSFDIPPARHGTAYTLRFYSSPSCDPSEHGEGETFVAKRTLLIPADETFTVNLTIDDVPPGVLTATATDPQTGNTSEFSACLEIPAFLCGDGSPNGEISAADALVILRASVGSEDCAQCICDVNASGFVSTTDALLALKAGVGQPVTLTCPVCG